MYYARLFAIRLEGAAAMVAEAREVGYVHNGKNVYTTYKYVL